MEAIERQLQRLDPKYRARSEDAVHDMLLAIGDLSEEELFARVFNVAGAEAIDKLERARRIVNIRVAGQSRYIAVEDAAKYRDALGVPLPPGLPDSLLGPALDPLANLVLRYARTHAPFAPIDFSSRYGLSVLAVEALLLRLTSEGRILEGEFRPGGVGREWTDPDVLRMLRRRSLAKLRQEVEPVDQAALGRFTTTWQGVLGRRRGPEAVLDAVEQLQGAPLPASILETEILPARIEGYDPADLDTVAAAGEVIWVGVEPLGERDGRVALYLADHLTRLLPPPEVRAKTDGTPGREDAIVEYLKSHGASFFGALHEAVGGGYPADTVNALWNLAWGGWVTNDTFHALRAFAQVRPLHRRQKRRSAPVFRSRRLVPPSVEGRWSLLPVAQAVRPVQIAQALKSAQRGLKARAPANATEWAAAMSQQLLTRHGVLTRESLAGEQIPGGFGSVYPVLKAMEESGRVRRGYFVAGLGATQFALPGAVDLLRSLRDVPNHVEVAVLAATDPANPYGATLKWPAFGNVKRAERAEETIFNAETAKTAKTQGKPSAASPSSARGPTRSVGATVILVNGSLAGYLARGDRQLLAFLPESEPERSNTGRAVARALIDRARGVTGNSEGEEAPRGMLLEEIDGLSPTAHPLAPYLVEAGFIAGAMGFQATFRPSQPRTAIESEGSSPVRQA
jgi:ATP-dependent Lhr-like helicase